MKKQREVSPACAVGELRAYVCVQLRDSSGARAAPLCLNVFEVEETVAEFAARFAEPHAVVSPLVFVDGIVLQFDVVDADGHVSRVREDAPPSGDVFESADALRGTQLGLVDRQRSVLYARLHEIGALRYEASRRWTPAHINVDVRSRVPVSWPRAVSDALLPLATQPQRDVYARMLKYSVSEECVRNSQRANVRVSDMQWQWRRGGAREYFDVHALCTRFRTRTDVPFVQLVEYTGNPQQDLAASRVWLRRDFVKYDQYAALQRWEAQSAQDIELLHHPKGAACVRGFDETGTPFVFVVHGDGSIFVRASTDVPYDTFADWLQHNARAVGDKKSNNVFAYIAREVIAWMPGIDMHPERGDIYYLSSYFELYEPLGRDLRQWVRALDAFVREVPADQRAASSEVLHLKYKRISNYTSATAMYEAMTEHIYRTQLKEDDHIETELVRLLTTHYGKTADAATVVVDQWMRTARTRGQPLFAGVDIVILAQGRHYRVQVRGVHSLAYQQHISLFLDVFFGAYLSGAWRDIAGVACPVRPASPLAVRVVSPAARAASPNTGFYFEERGANEKLEDIEGLDLDIPELDFELENDDVKGGGAGHNDEDVADTLGEPVRTRRGYLISKLREADRELFDYPSEKKYSRFCQTRHGRVPVVVGNEHDFADMVRRLQSANKTGVGAARTNKTGVGAARTNKTGVGAARTNKTDVGEVLRGDTRSMIVKDVASEEGYALKYRDSYYVCPEAWCVVCKLPLMLRDMHARVQTPQGVLPYDEHMRKSERAADMTVVSGTCPYCGRGVVTGDKIDDDNSVLVSAGVLGRQGFPGFINPSSHPLGLCMLCCFNKPYTRIDKSSETRVAGARVFTASVDDARSREAAARGRNVDTRSREAAARGRNVDTNDTNTRGNAARGNAARVSDIVNNRVSPKQSSPAVERDTEDKIMYVMIQSKFVHLNKYGLLPDALSDVLNRGAVLQRYRGTVGIPFGKKSSEYMQFLRRGVAWSKGMFTNLMDVMHYYIFGASAQVVQRENKIADIVAHLERVPHFGDLFELVADGYVASVFARAGGGTASDPVKALFAYLRSSPVWHDDLVLPLFGVPGVIPMARESFPVFLLFEESEPGGELALRFSSAHVTPQHVVYAMIKRRVMGELPSHAAQWWVSGGWNYEPIVYLHKEKNRVLRETCVFHVSREAITDVNTEQDAFAFVVRTVADVVTWAAPATPAHLPGFPTLDDVVRVLRAHPTMRVGGQWVDIMFRTTHILIVYGTQTLWLPIAPQRIITPRVSDRGTRARVVPYYFARPSDRAVIARHVHDVRATVRAIDAVRTAFEAAGVVWPFRAPALIVRREQAGAVRHDVAGTQFVTGIALGDAATVYVRRELRDVALARLEDPLPLADMAVDAARYDMHVADSVLLHNDVTARAAVADADARAWEDLLYAFHRFCVKTGVPDTPLSQDAARKLVIDFAEDTMWRAEDARSNTLSNSRSTVPVRATRNTLSNSRSTVPVRARRNTSANASANSRSTVPVRARRNTLSNSRSTVPVRARRMLKRLVVLLSRNEYFRHNIVSPRVKWTRPTKTRSTDFITFLFAEWKFAIVDYFTKSHAL